MIDCGIEYVDVFKDGYAVYITFTFKINEDVCPLQNFYRQ